MVIFLGLCIPIIGAVLSVYGLIVSVNEECESDWQCIAYVVIFTLLGALGIFCLTGRNPIGGCLIVVVLVFTIGAAIDCSTYAWIPIVLSVWILIIGYSAYCVYTRAGPGMNNAWNKLMEPEIIYIYHEGNEEQRID